MTFEIDSDEAEYIIRQEKMDYEPDTTKMDEWIKDNYNDLMDDFVGMYKDEFTEYCKEQYSRGV